MSVRADFTDGAYGSNFGVSGQALPKIYLDAWYYMDAGPPYSRNHKLFRIHSGTDGQPNLFYNIYCKEIRSSLLSQDGVGGNYYQWMGPTADYFERKWVHLQGYFEESSPGTNNGTAEFWVDGEKHVSQVGNFRTRDSSSAAWNAAWFGNYFGHGSEGCSTGYGGRVHLLGQRLRRHDTRPGGDWRLEHVRQRPPPEIQVPVSWADNSISVRLNQGGFANISGLFLFVIDSAGNASPGYRLGSASTLPTAPRNLWVTLPG